MFDENIEPQGEGTNPDDSEETTTTEPETEEVEGEQEAEPDYKLELEREKKKAYELEQRLKKERAKSKERSDLSSPDVPVNENAIQEQVLKAQGMSVELINVLKTISEDQGVDLITAQQDDYFVFRKEKMEQEARDKEAALGASKGAGAGKPRKDFTTKGLTADEHKAMWKKTIGR